MKLKFKIQPFQTSGKNGDVRQIISYSKAFGSFPKIVQPSMLLYTSFEWHINL